MRTVFLLLLDAVLLAALTNCGSSPKTHYYTLTAVPGTASDKASIALPVTVAAVHLPSSLDRSEMVHRTGATTVDVSNQDRWAAPLDEMARRVLSEDLAARLSAGKVVLPDSPSPPHTREIVVTLSQFGPDANGKTTLKGSWSLIERAGANPMLRRDVALETSLSSEGGAGEAAGMSQLLDELAGQIAATLARTARAAEPGRAGERGHHRFVPAAERGEA